MKMQLTEDISKNNGFLKKRHLSFYSAGALETWAMYHTDVTPH